MIYLISVFGALILAAMESVTYLGFVQKHLGVPAAIFYLVSLLVWRFPHASSKRVSMLLTLAATGASALYLGLIFVETITYPNFVFAHTHINPLAFQFCLALIWLHLFLLQKMSFGKSLLLASLIYVGIDGAGRSLALLTGGLIGVVQDPFATYESKMTKVYPGFYPAMQTIKKITPENATILIPPQASPWELEGNGAMVIYFLYPRTVSNLSLDGQLPPATGPTYVLISKGSESIFTHSHTYEYGWPKIPLEAKVLWQIDPTRNAVYQHARNYDPRTDQWDWGLIEVAYE